MPINWGDVGAFGAGTVDELLFGLPEYIAKKVDRKAVQEYIDKHKTAYNIGEGVGTVGSAFIPYAGIAGKALKGAGLAGKGIGLASKALKAADVGSDIIRAGDTALDVAKIAGAAEKGADALKGAGRFTDALAKYANLAGKGALAGGAEAGVRGITSEKTPEQILKDIQSGVTFGGVGGVAGGLLGGAAKRLAGEGAKSAEKAFIATTDLKKRDMTGMLRDMSGTGAKGLGKFKNADFAREEAVRVGKKIGANIPGVADPKLIKYGQQWKQLDDISEALAPDATAATWYKKAAENLDMDSLYKEFGADNVKNELANILKEGESTSGLFNTRNNLQDIVKDARKSTGPSKIARLKETLAHDLRSGVDEQVMDMAKKSGSNLDFDEMKKDYLPMRAYAEAMGRADVAPSGISAGSPTMEKMATSEILKQIGKISGTSALGGIAGYNSSPGEMKDKLLNAAGGSIIGGLGSRAIASLGTRGIAATIPIAKLLEKGVNKIAPDALAKFGAKSGGQLASIAARKATAQVQPQTAQEAEAVNMAAAAGSGDKPAYMQQVFSKLNEFAVTQGVKEGTPQYDTFIKEVAQMTGGFNPEAMAGLFYQDPAERAAYTKAYRVSSSLAQSFPKATTGKPGFMGTEAPEAGIERNSAIDQLGSLVGDVAKEKGSEAEAKKALAKILNSNADEVRKMELVKTLLSAYGVDFGTLERIGL